jgi:hypothetical protein
VFVGRTLDSRGEGTWIGLADEGPPQEQDGTAA